MKDTKILFVDDSKFEVIPYLERLTIESYQYIYSENCDKALEILKSEGNNIKVAILDCMLPPGEHKSFIEIETGNSKLVGITLARYITKNYPHIKIIGFSHINEIEVEKEFIQLGATYIYKLREHSTDELFATIAYIYKNNSIPPHNTHMADNPLPLLKEAIKKVPSLKYALGVVGMAAAVTLIGTLRDNNYKIPVFSLLILLGFMILLFLFSALMVEAKAAALRLAAYILVYTTVIITCVASVLLMTSIFFDFPKPIGDYKLFGASTKKSEEVTKTDSLPSLPLKPRTIASLNLANKKSIDVFEIERYLTNNNTTPQYRYLVWDTCLRQLNDGMNADADDSYGRLITDKRRIIDGYLASCKLMKVESRFLLEEEELHKINLQKELSSFIQDLLLGSERTKCFIRGNLPSSVCGSGMGTEEEKLDNEYSGIVSFRLKLGELIYQNVNPSKNVHYSIAEYSGKFPPQMRNPALIKYLWSSSKNLIYKLITPQLFKEKQYDKVVDGLIASHETLYTRDYKSYFNSILEEKSKGSNFNETKGLPMKDIVETNSYWGLHFNKWFYSFWYRRFVENTDSTVFEILKEIKFHYSGKLT